MTITYYHNVNLWQCFAASGPLILLASISLILNIIFLHKGHVSIMIWPILRVLTALTLGIVFNVTDYESCSILIP
jgi:hypothetical protein